MDLKDHTQKPGVGNHVLYIRYGHDLYYNIKLIIDECNQRQGRSVLEVAYFITAYHSLPQN